MRNRLGCNSGNTLAVKIGYSRIKILLKRIVLTDKNCWNWSGYCNKNGYGIVRYKSRMVRAHRLFYAFFVGKIPSGKLVCHKCNNRKCVNPEHLYLGTHKENMIDRKMEDRSYKPLGEKNNNSKLTKVHIIEIHKLWHNGITHKEIGNIFGVSECAISSIVNNRNWDWLNLTWNRQVRKKAKIEYRKK